MTQGGIGREVASVNAVSNRTMGPLVMLVWALVIVVTVAFWPRW
jgi:hypothetical protein